MLSASDERLLRLPKAELHVHLDGSLRAETLIELAAERGVPLPAREPRALARSMVVTDATGLEEYLRRFEVTLRVMQDSEAIERIAYEVVDDHARESVRWLEVRFCPGLCTTGGLSPDEVLDATLSGLARGRHDHGLPAAVIVTALRTLPPSASLEMAELAVAYRDRGVCAFDLAGAEAGHPVRRHRQAVAVALEGGLPLTIHAGEGYGVDSIRDALTFGHATRIGHGTRLADDPELLAAVRDAGVVLEVCLTSNVQTHVVPSYADHPLRRFYDEGVRVSLCTDNRLISGVTLTREYAHARDALGFSWDELVDIARTGLAGAYAPPAEKDARLARFEAEVATL